MSVELIRRGQSQIYGQVGVGLKGQTWINLADAGDTSPQTVENLGAAKTYLLINSEGANVEIDTVDTPTPVKLTGDTEFDFVWASGKIALYELSAEETALDASVLGQKYHYVSGTKSTLPATVKSVGKNLFDKSKVSVGRITNYGYLLPAQDTNRTSDFIPVRPNTTYVLYNAMISSSHGLAFFDKNKQNISEGDLSSGYSVTRVFTTGSNTYYVRASVTASKLDIAQLEKGTTPTTYEPYKESIVYINGDGELRSLPNGTKDEVNVTSGIKTQRVGNKTNVDSGTVINYTDMATAGQFEAWGSGEHVVGVKGDTLAFTATSLTYQLATPITTYIDPQPLQIFPNGNRWVEFANKEVAVYNTGIHVANTDLPIREMIKVDKIGLLNGRWYRESVDLANVTVAPDGLSFTIDGAESGAFEQYEFAYYYDSALSTLPELVIPDEPSLVTIKNRNISL